MFTLAREDPWPPALNESLVFATSTSMEWELGA